MTIARAGFTVTAAVATAAVLVVATRKFRRADRVARRQMKWVVAGTYGACLPVMVAGERKSMAYA